MKSVIINISLVLFFLIMNGYKQPAMAQQPGRGVIYSEAQVGFFFSGFGTFNQNQLKVRYHLDSNWAVYLGPEFTSYSSEFTVYENPNGNGRKGLYSQSSRNTLLNLGVQRFFRINKNMSPYVGVQYGLGTQAYQLLLENCRGRNNYQFGFNSETKNISRQQQILAISGMEYWFSKGFCLGIQVGLTGTFTRTLSSKTIINDQGNIQETKQPPFTTINFTSASTTGFKIGWRFN